MTTKVNLKTGTVMDVAQAERITSRLKERGITKERIAELRAALRSRQPLTVEQTRDIIAALEACKLEWH